MTKKLVIGVNKNKITSIFATDEIEVYIYDFTERENMTSSDKNLFEVQEKEFEKISEGLKEVF